MGVIQGGRGHAAIPQHGADAVGAPADLAAGHLVRGAGDLRDRRVDLAAEQQRAADRRPDRQGQPRLPSQEREGRTQGCTRRPRPAPGRRRSQAMNIGVISLAFFAMLGMMLLGMPIATSMAALGVIGGIAAYGTPFLDSIAPVVWGVQNDSLLTSVPLFVLLGELLLRSGIADRMYVALSAWLGRLPGGLLHTNIGSCALFAATSGSSVATAATIGTVALPSLQRRGYPMRASLGSLAAGGTRGILIPPSVNMIVYGSLTNNSIGKLFLVGIFSGLLLTGCFM